MGKLYNNDCFTVLPTLGDESVDLILTDPPYGVTRCKWDTPIDLNALWPELMRVAKPNAAIIMTATMPFAATLVASNFKYFRYDWVWEKSKATGHLNAKKMPLRAHEGIYVFSKKPTIYNPQMWQGKPYDKGKNLRMTDVYGSQVATHVKSENGLRYPRSVQYFKTAETEGQLHPTQKPVKLFEYLINTYSLEGDTVLDPFGGGGTTAIAAMNTGRDFIIIEKEIGYAEVIRERIAASGGSL